jgi:hypothetical protein
MMMIYNLTRVSVVLGIDVFKKKWANLLASFAVIFISNKSKFWRNSRMNFFDSIFLKQNCPANYEVRKRLENVIQGVF